MGLRPATLAPVNMPTSTRRPFYGWVIVATSCFQLTFAAGLGFYGLPVYLRTLKSARGFSVAWMSGATSVFWIASGLTGILVARFLARYDPRVFVAIGAALSGLSIAALGHVTQLWQVFVVYAFFGVGFCCSAVIVTNTVIMRWFHKRRSVALSIATTGLSLGGVVLTPIATSLLNHRSLSSAFSIIALLFFIGVLIVPMIFLRGDPSTKGTYADGIAPVVHAGSNVGTAPGVPFEVAVRSRAFAAITAAFALGLLAQLGAISQLVNLATERAGKGVGDRIVIVLASCSVVGRLLGGAFVQRASTRKFAFAALGLQATGLFLISFASGAAAMYGATIAFGFAIGNVLLLHPLLIAEVFGVRDYPRVYGRSQLFVALGNATGPLSVGWLRDNAGGYRTAILVACAVNIVALATYVRGGGVSAENAAAANVSVA
jgi:predicted MFS family arabinose efflux permease